MLLKKNYIIMYKQFIINYLTRRLLKISQIRALKQP